MSWRNPEFAQVRAGGWWAIIKKGSYIQEFEFGVRESAEARIDRAIKQDKTERRITATAVIQR